MFAAADDSGGDCLNEEQQKKWEAVELTDTICSHSEICWASVMLTITQIVLQARRPTPEQTLNCGHDKQRLRKRRAGEGEKHITNESLANRNGIIIFSH